MHAVKRFVIEFCLLQHETVVGVNKAVDRDLLKSSELHSVLRTGLGRHVFSEVKENIFVLEPLRHLCRAPTSRNI